ncbi:MAG: toll/interleukin-1 receptor domain-containing protein [Planctomycetaceae bacterium]|nr:toll/interleukin-1 receptor domain-containing protein [Planctomycetaceae bacterium]
MAQLTILERRQLETLLQMGGGYILDFSNRTFEEFVADSVGLEIFAEKYHYGSGSKANRLRGFLKVESDAVSAKLIRDLVDYAEFVTKNEDPDLIANCKAIAERLGRGTSKSVVVQSIHQSVQVSADDGKQPKRVFISYSWDDDSHKDWVRELADAIAANGIDIILDQYDLRIGEDRFQFMEASVREADAVLCVCTPLYVEKANARSSGVGIETSLITPQFYQRVGSSKQFIPIIRSSREGQSPVPDYLKTLLFIDFRQDLHFSEKMDELTRHLHNQPKFQKPQVGPVPKFD